MDQGQKQAEEAAKGWARMRSLWQMGVALVGIAFLLCGFVPGAIESKYDVSSIKAWAITIATYLVVATVIAGVIRIRWYLQDKAGE